MASLNSKQFTFALVQSFVYTQLGIGLNTVFFVYTHLNVKTVLFQIIQFSMSTKLNGSKYCYISLTIQLNISHLFTHS